MIDSFSGTAAGSRPARLPIPDYFGGMENLKETAKPVVAMILFAVLHAWALAMLWVNGPANRQTILVVVYTAFLVGSCVVTKSFRPPLLPSLLLFGVVFVWRFFFL